MESHKVMILASLVVLFSGILLKFFPPKNRFGLLGYKTPNSKTSQEKWDVAQSYSSNLIILFFSVSVIIQLIINYLAVISFAKASTLIALLLLLFPITLIIILTELRLNKIS